MIFLACSAVVLSVLLALEAMILAESGGDDRDAPAAAVLVLGAGVNGETPSLSLQSRINTAAEYLKLHPELSAVLSGGQGSGESISEAEAMRRGLIQHGIDEERLLLEEHSANTAENFEFSLKLLRENGISPEKSVAVISNDFHLFRAKLIARRAGMASPIGIPADLPWWLDVNYYTREAFAAVKTLLFD